MTDLVILIEAQLGSMFDVRSIKAKNRMFEFDHHLMNTFEVVRFSKNDIENWSMFDKMVFNL